MSHVQTLQFAVAAIRAGNTELARQQLQLAAQQSPGDPAVWLWMGWLADSPASMIECLEMVLDSEFHDVASAGIDFARKLSAINSRSGSARPSAASPPDNAAATVENSSAASVSNTAVADGRLASSPSDNLATADASSLVSQPDISHDDESSDSGPLPVVEAAHVVSSELEAWPHDIPSDQAETSSKRDRAAPAQGVAAAFDIDEDTERGRDFGTGFEVRSRQPARHEHSERPASDRPGHVQPSPLVQAGFDEDVFPFEESDDAEAESGSSRQPAWNAESQSEGSVSSVSPAPDAAPRSRLAASHWFNVGGDDDEASEPAGDVAAESRLDFKPDPVKPPQGRSGNGFQPQSRALWQSAGPNAAPADSGYQAAPVVPRGWMPPGSAPASERQRQPDSQTLRPPFEPVPVTSPQRSEMHSHSDEPLQGTADSLRCAQYAAPTDRLADHDSTAPSVCEDLDDDSFDDSGFSGFNHAPMIPPRKTPQAAGLMKAEPPDSADSGSNTVPDDSTLRNDGRSTESDARDSGRKTILVVDDSPTVRKLVAMTLEKRGYHVVSAFDGVAAIKEIAAHNPALILMDVSMPRLDGYQLCKLVKKHDSTRHIPVLMLSGKDGVFDRLRGRLVGCCGYVSKPFVPEQLVDAVEQNLGNAQLS